MMRHDIWKVVYNKGIFIRCYPNFFERTFQSIGLTMAKKKMAHSSLNASWFALFRLNYRKSVTVRKIFESSLKLDQAEYCEFFCLKMTTKWSWSLCFCLSRSFDHQNFPCFSMYQWKYLSKSKKIHEEKKI